MAYLEVSLRNSLSNGKDSGMFFKAIVVVAGVTFAVVVALGAVSYTHLTLPTRCLV